jgi:hypothetical protein
MEWLWDWLKQPSTLRALNILVTAIAGLAGYQYEIDPEMWMALVGLFASVWLVIDGFYNKQPAKPKENEEECCK